MADYQHILVHRLLPEGWCLLKHQQKCRVVRNIHYVVVHLPHILGNVSSIVLSCQFFDMPTDAVNMLAGELFPVFFSLGIHVIVIVREADL